MSVKHGWKSALLWEDVPIGRRKREIDVKDAYRMWKKYTRTTP